MICLFHAKKNAERRRKHARCTFVSLKEALNEWDDVEEEKGESFHAGKVGEGEIVTHERVQEKPLLPKKTARFTRISSRECEVCC